MKLFSTYYNVTDGQTDGRTDGRLAVAIPLSRRWQRRRRQTI